MTSLEECFENGMLKKCPSDKNKALLSLKLAKENLKDAEIQLDNGLLKWAFIAAYTSTFHAARALLYRDGVKERSHYCLWIYLKEKYRNVIEAKYINELNLLREQRHRILYGDADLRSKEVESAEAESALAVAGGFLQTIEKLIKNG